MRRTPCFAACAFLLVPYCTLAQQHPSLEKIDQIVQREKQEIQEIAKYQPLVETYLQDLSNREGKLSVSSDHYFLSTVRFDPRLKVEGFKPRGDEILNSVKVGVEDLNVFSVKYLRGGFYNMAFPDPGTFDQKHYRFEFIKREFLGELRCWVYEVTPLAKGELGMFKGRIWVEEQDSTIVRFNGLFQRRALDDMYFHFDSWRFNTGGNLWLPAVTYSEESDMPCCLYGKLNYRRLRFRAQTRMWGYNVKRRASVEEFSKIELETKDAIEDRSEDAHDSSPIEAMRAWDLQAENNVLDQLARIRLLATPGTLEEKLGVLVNNLEATNKLDVEPEIRCRVLLTSRLESFVVGHTIVLSKGLIDVSPQEAVLATVIAHGIAHIELQGPSDTRFAFSDRLMFPVADTVKDMNFHPDPRFEERVNKRTFELMQNSPYKANLAAVAAFFVALKARAPHLRQLLSPNLGEPLTMALEGFGQKTTDGQRETSMAWAALPLGSRTRVDPWSNAVEVQTPQLGGPPPAYDDLEFGLTPVYLHLQRAPNSEPVARVAGPREKNSNAGEHISP